MFITTFLVTSVVIVVLIAMIAIRIIFIKDGEFRGSCSSNNPFTKREGGVCSLCGASSEESCAQKDTDPAKATSDVSPSSASRLVQAEERQA